MFRQLLPRLGPSWSAFLITLLSGAASAMLYSLIGFLTQHFEYRGLATSLVIPAIVAPPLCYIFFNFFNQLILTEAELRNRNEMIRLITDGLPVLIAYVDQNERYRFVNKAYEGWFSNPKGDIIGRKVAEVVGPEVYDQVRNNAATALTGQSASFESRMTQPNGRTVHFQARYIPHVTADGRPAGYIALVEDVTERKLYEQELLTKEYIIDSAASVIATADMEGKMTYVNPAFLNIWGIDDASEVYGRPFQDFWLVDHRRPKMLDAFKTKGGWSGEVKAKRKDGSLFDVLISSAVVRNKSGRPICLMASCDDITHRKRAEEALRVSEIKYRSIFEQSRDAIYITSPEGRVIDINQAGSDIMGYSREEFQDVNVNEQYVDPEERARVKEELNRCGFFKNREIALKHKDGHEIVCMDNAALWRDESGQVRGYIGTLRDITAWKRAEAERELLEKQLLQAQKMEAVGTLASGVAHDFNNLLQAISGYLQLLLIRPGLDQACQDYLREMDGAMERAAELVRRLLTFSRKVEPELKPLNLNRVLLRSIPMLQRTLPKMISVKADLETEIKPVHADSIQIEQIMMNLFSNAADAMPQGGTLTIRTRDRTLDESFCRDHMGSRPGEFICVSVTDTGTGMEPDVVDHIFDPFFTTKEVGKGTGLGLAMVYGIVKNHRGYVTCRSTPNQGTSFDIFLPASDEPPVLVEAKPLPKPEAVNHRGEETILVVDDERAVIEITREILTENGYTVITADCGETALDVYRERGLEIDLALLDLGMPGMGGHRCLSEIIKLNPEAQVIIASGYVHDEETRSALRPEAAGFISKPYRLVDLLTMVRQVLDARRTKEARPLSRLQH